MSCCVKNIKIETLITCLKFVFISFQLRQWTMKRWAILSNSWRRDRGGQVGSIYRLPVHPVHLLSTSLFIVYGTSPFIVYQSIYWLPVHLLSPSPFYVYQPIYCLPVHLLSTSPFIVYLPAHPVHLLSTSSSSTFIVNQPIRFIYCLPAHPVHLSSTCPFIVHLPIYCLPAHSFIVYLPINCLPAH